ncbi:hypothetical protein TrLO_g12766 [Triparma laevis f. longispina]|uniref:Uncharacterized protein n=1 Tax=Triparma laevis f. longispina TaxID=1714387 RepID=A0A9W7E6E9_9STRA|nr:hypothetical protein TrLO_g12766 [Triparma laevis f. longispina]
MFQTPQKPQIKTTSLRKSFNSAIRSIVAATSTKKNVVEIGLVSIVLRDTEEKEGEQGACDDDGPASVPEQESLDDPRNPAPNGHSP